MILEVEYMVSLKVRNEIMDLTTTEILPIIDNVYKESLRAVLHAFGNLYYIDGNGNKVKVKCSHGNPERIAGRLKADNTLILPMMTVVETGTTMDQDRSRYQAIISEKVWDEKKLRAKRVLSLPPRPISISYSINIWAKYKADLDMLRSCVFSLFSPDLEIKTDFSQFNKAFISDERDVGNLASADGSDRILQKTINIRFETYIPSPKFLYTNTGAIEVFNYDINLS
jgi:hypothetical protein